VRRTEGGATIRRNLSILLYFAIHFDAIVGRFLVS
jgi:hypothetical protein